MRYKQMCNKLMLAGACVLVLSGCSTTPPGTPVRNTAILDHAYSAYKPRPAAPTMPDQRPVCNALGTLEQAVRQGRAEGISKEQAKTTVVVLGNQAAEGNRQLAQVTGIANLMVVDHVYSGRTDSVPERCMSESWPLAIYLETM